MNKKSDDLEGWENINSDELKRFEKQNLLLYCIEYAKNSKTISDLIELIYDCSNQANEYFKDAQNSTEQNIRILRRQKDVRAKKGTRIYEYNLKKLEVLKTMFDQLKEYFQRIDDKIEWIGEQFKNDEELSDHYKCLGLHISGSYKDLMTRIPEYYSSDKNIS